MLHHSIITRDGFFDLFCVLPLAQFKDGLITKVVFSTNEVKCSVMLQGVFMTVVQLRSGVKPSN